jgi:outer membrane protein assembly factor BamA
MRLLTLLLLVILSQGPVASQNATFPLESVAIEGSSIPKPVILEVAGLRIGAPVNKGAIEQGCQKLNDSGLFSSITYRYRPGSNGGYAVTLALADQEPLVAAVIDVPGVEEAEAWKWMAGKFSRFDRQVPEAGAAQKFLAGQLQAHLAGPLRGQRLTVQMEGDLKTRTLTLSFQPEVLPRIHSIAFTGNRAVPSGELDSVLRKTVTHTGYTSRKFNAAIEMNLRPLYEERGFYRVQFVPGAPQWSDTGVSLAVAITEGDPYQLGHVELAGEDLPHNAMTSAAGFPKGKLANWKEIQNGLWAMESVLKKAGYLEAAAISHRSFDDTARILNLRVQMNKGPLYRFGEVQISGLTPELENRARQTWKPKPGDPYDLNYPHEFVRFFSRTEDLTASRKGNVMTQKGAGQNVIDILLVFEPR